MQYEFLYVLGVTRTNFGHNTHVVGRILDTAYTILHPGWDVQDYSDHLKLLFYDYAHI